MTAPASASASPPASWAAGEISAPLPAWASSAASRSNLAGKSHSAAAGCAPATSCLMNACAR
jgi:hypothetical protein